MIKQDGGSVLLIRVYPGRSLLAYQSQKLLSWLSSVFVFLSFPVAVLRQLYMTSYLVIRLVPVTDYMLDALGGDAGAPTANRL